MKQRSLQGMCSKLRPLDVKHRIASWKIECSRKYREKWNATNWKDFRCHDSCNKFLNTLQLCLGNFAALKINKHVFSHYSCPIFLEYCAVTTVAAKLFLSWVADGCIPCCPGPWCLELHHEKSNVLKNTGRIPDFLWSCHDACSKFLRTLQHCLEIFAALRIINKFSPLIHVLLFLSIVSPLPRQQSFFCHRLLMDAFHVVPNRDAWNYFMDNLMFLKIPAESLTSPATAKMRVTNFSAFYCIVSAFLQN